MTAEGCLSSSGLVSGNRIKSKPCRRTNSQVWKVSDDGRIMSTVDSNWCFSKSGQTLVIDMCDNAPSFGYNVFDNTLHLLKNPNKVVSTGYLSNSRVKIVQKTGGLSEHVELV